MSAYTPLRRASRACGEDLAGPRRCSRRPGERRRRPPRPVQDRLGRAYLRCASAFSIAFDVSGRIRLYSLRARAFRASARWSPRPRRSRPFRAYRSGIRLSLGSLGGRVPVAGRASGWTPRRSRRSRDEVHPGPRGRGPGRYCAGTRGSRCPPSSPLQHRIGVRPGHPRRAPCGVRGRGLAERPARDRGPVRGPGGLRLLGSLEEARANDGSAGFAARGREGFPRRGDRPFRDVRGARAVGTTERLPADVAGGSTVRYSDSQRGQRAMWLQRGVALRTRRD